MIRTIIFILYALLYCFLYKFTLDYSLQRRITNSVSWESPKPLKFLKNILVFCGIPYYFIVGAGILWGFTEQPYVSLRMSLGTNLSLVLAFAVFISLAISYMVIYQVGYMKGSLDADQAWKAR